MAHVLSQASRASVPRTRSATPRRSVTEIVGFDGVSVHTRRVVGLRAARTAERSVMSTKDTSSPQRTKWSFKSLGVPKYASRGATT